MIIRVYPLGPLQTNAILLGCSETKKAAVIDPSQGATEVVLLDCIQLGLKIEKIILTHSHWDHIVDVVPLKERTGASVYVHELDALNVIEPGTDKLPLFFPIKGVKPDVFFADGEWLEVGYLKIQVIHTPGHSPGSVCLYIPAQKLLLSGDTLFQGSIGNLSLPTARANEMWDSLKKLASLPPDTRVIPGHGSETKIGREHWLGRAKEFFKE